MTHLNGHQRDTLEHLFAHPTSRNLQWVDVLSLINGVGEADEKHDGALRVTIGSETEVFQRRAKDVTVEQIADLRRMMRHHGLVEEFGIVDHHGNGAPGAEATA